MPPDHQRHSFRHPQRCCHPTSLQGLGHDLDVSKAQRIDLDADFHHTRDGNLTKVPGRELVMLSCRTGHGNERVPLDAEFMPRKDHRSRKNRNEADFALDMLERLIAENRTALRGRPGHSRWTEMFHA